MSKLSAVFTTRRGCSYNRFRYLLGTFGVLGFGSAAAVYETFRYNEITGSSMLNTLEDGDVVISETLSVRLHKLKKGDIVVSYSPLHPEECLVKRIKSTGGEDVTYYDIDTHKKITRRIPRGMLWLEGDNTENSEDSREFGPVPAGLILHRCFMIALPLSRFGLISSNEPSSFAAFAKPTER